MTRMARWAAVIAQSAALVLLSVSVVSGQAGSGGELVPRRPGDARPRLPDFDPLGPVVPESVLPPAPSPAAPGSSSLSGPGIFVERYRFEGNTVIDDEELEAVAAQYTNRDVSFAELEQLRQALTGAYVDHGYVSSGALIHEQRVEGGVVEVTLVEGWLSAVRIEGVEHFREGPLRRRIEAAAGRVVNIHDLEEGLQVLRRDPLIAGVQARLEPGESRGEAVLWVAIREAPPYFAGSAYQNYQSPSIGSRGSTVELGYANLIGVGDRISAVYTRTAGLDEVSGRFELPLNRWGTRFDLHFRLDWSEIVEEPFDALEIKNQGQTYGFTLRQPLYQSVHTDLSVFLTGEWRRNTSYLSGRRFSFSPGVEDGVSSVTVFRVGQDFTYRDSNQVFAVRNTLTGGVDLLGATTNPNHLPDGRFFAWLGQFQWARRIGWLNSQMLLRTDVQLSNAPLLGLEQFAVGGHATVRGYRENQLVHDQGVVASLEWRVPVWQDRFLDLSLAPFFDVGRSWNRERPTTSPKTIYSAGIALSAEAFGFLNAELSWARDLRDVDNLTSSDLQDDGFYFSVSARFPRGSEE